MSLVQRLAHLATETEFSGVVRVRGIEAADLAAGYADRANERPIGSATRFATASATKGFTALTVMSMIESGSLTVDTAVRSIVGDDLPNVDERVTVQQLLSHRSGVGDYLDEDELDDIDAHVFAERSVHTFAVPSDYLALLAVPATRDEPGVRFAYNNSGFVILSLLVERLTGSFTDAVVERVFRPAGMERSGFFRSDDLPADVALGYLQNGRTNVHHLPVVGAGDGGAYTCVEDLDRFWDAFLSGVIVSSAAVAQMTTPSDASGEGATGPAYGLGFWLSDNGDHVWLEGMDAGVSMQSGVRRSTGDRYTVMANTSSGAWPLVRAVLDDR